MSANRNIINTPNNFSFFEYQPYQTPTDKVRFSIKMAQYISDFNQLQFLNPF